MPPIWTIFSSNCGNGNWLFRGPRWRGRAGTVRAMAVLTTSRIIVAAAPFQWWRGALGLRYCTSDTDAVAETKEARRLASQVERAAARLPFATKCLPRAVALSWLLRRKHIGHSVVFAVRPAELRQSADALHAWVEVAGTTVIGDLPGPWVETLRLGRDGL